MASESVATEEGQALRLVQTSHPCLADQVHERSTGLLLQVNPQASASAAVGTALCLISNAKGLADQCDEVIPMTIAHMLDIAYALIASAVGEDAEQLDEEAAA